jgi:hypothetical protein
MYVAEVRGIDGKVVPLILFGKGERQRFIQDTPILPDVWNLFAEKPAERHDLLISPLASHSSISVMREVKSALQRRLPKSLTPTQIMEGLAPARLAPLQSFVAACLSFDELIEVVLPRTAWAAEARARFEKKEGAAVFDPDKAIRQVCDAALGYAPSVEKPLRGQLFEAARVLTLIATIQVSQDPDIPEIDDITWLPQLEEPIVARMKILFERLSKSEPVTPLIARVTSNRPVEQSSLASRETVKADAGSRLFDVKCQSITWGVIDSGIDRDHPAFKRRKPGPNESASRVIRSYELGNLRALLNVAYEENPAANPVLETCIRDSGLSPAQAKTYLEKAYRSYETEILDWSSIEPLLRLAKPSIPADGHGTHVAGIIGGDWEEDGQTWVKGICPDIQLMDFRIIGSDLDETEYAVLGALQLVRYLNSHNQHIKVHGVNVSLSIPHKVGSFGCGRTPVCMECERLIGAGTTVVAAAGNAGYHEFDTGAGSFRGYAPLSITDPGNAEGVITVGATHKREPHAYGVSYFSSRGPTADGRMKPDLLAPGERIESCLPDSEKGPLDGTSQAAPHVSGAAAMLMARYPELNREPRRIKQILCDSATDLGRERAFQGHGLLDVLRALQSF